MKTANIHKLDYEKCNNKKKLVAPIVHKSGCILQWLEFPLIFEHTFYTNIAYKKSLSYWKQAVECFKLKSMQRKKPIRKLCYKREKILGAGHAQLVVSIVLIHSTTYARIYCKLE